MTSRFSPGFALRVAVFLYVTVQCCPIEFFPIGTSVDASWQLGLNLAAEQGLRFGEDILWPSGPFAYLDTPMPVGDNLAKGLAAQLALWALVAAALAELIFLHRPQAPGLLALAACVGVGAPLFHFNGQGMDSLLAFLALLMAASALRSDAWIPRLTAAAIAAGLAGVFKLSAAVIGGTGVAVAALFIGRRDLRDGLRALAIVGLAGPGATLAAYLIHNPSPSGFWRYVASLLMFSSGYSAAMSIGGENLQFRLNLAIAIVLLLGVLAVSLFRRDREATAVAALFALPLLVSFKHGFVRADSHIASFSCFAAVALGVTLAYADWTRINRPLTVVCTSLTLPLALLMSTWSASEWARLPLSDPAAVFGRTLAGAAALQDVEAALNLPRTHSKLLEQSRGQHLQASRAIPVGLRDRVAAEPVAVLSPYFGMASLDGLNLQLLPILQKYGAYTPTLDAELADWLQGEGPEKLLFEWKAIDGRHPLLETPLSWAVVWRSFDCVAVEDGWALLQRRSSSRFEEPVRSAALSPTDNRIGLPDHDGPLFASLRLSSTLGAKVKQALFRSPPMEIAFELASGEKERYRTFPGALESVVPVSPLPVNLQEFAALLAPEGQTEGASRVRAIELPAADGYVSTSAVILQPLAQQTVPVRASREESSHND